MFQIKGVLVVFAGWTPKNDFGILLLQFFELSLQFELPPRVVVKNGFACFDQLSDFMA